MTTLNERAYELANAMVADADKLGIAVSTLDCGTRIIDCGVKAAGSIEAGLRLADICMSGLGYARLDTKPSELWDQPRVFSTTFSPMAACMASQYAGWQIQGEKFFAMGSGPMRAAACREELFKHIGNCERPRVCVGVLETGKLPPESVCRNIAEKCGLAPDMLTLLVAPTASHAGTVQIVARSVETALHKLHELDFDISRIEHAFGTAPLPPVADDDMTAIGWTNDAILYGALTVLFTHGDDASIEQVGPLVPSSASPDYGQPFREIFDRYNGDFYRIDPMLFSPAKISIYNIDTDNMFRFGRFAPDVISKSFASGGKK
jgi:methenyltetrahydromethanopterin cyclohydrolase